MRANMDDMYDDAYEKAMAMAAKVRVAPTALRVAARQRHRAKAPAPTAKDIIGSTWLLHFLICTETIFHLHSSSRQNFGGGELSMQSRKSSRTRVPQP